jgi:hypothetical protein
MPHVIGRLAVNTKIVSQHATTTPKINANAPNFMLLISSTSWLPNQSRTPEGNAAVFI